MYHFVVLINEETILCQSVALKQCLNGYSHFPKQNIVIQCEYQLMHSLNATDLHRTVSSLNGNYPHFELLIWKTPLIEITIIYYQL